jgi:peptidoglycan/LPS O-acetylase OafA/YrhL
MRHQARNRVLIRLAEPLVTSTALASAARCGDGCAAIRRRELRLSAQPHNAGAYRRDIDGLRALAVTVVVAFHAFPAAVPGGYVGVDVFFVISGFLISRILFDEASATGRIDLLAFYRRRLRRIVPALALVLAAVLAFGWLTLLPEEYANLGRDAAGSAGFVANLVFWSGAGYFAPGAEHTPLLHLWSLAIEEQFYLVWPLLVMAFARNPRLRALAMGAILLASLGICLAGDSAIGSFYSPFTRAWELLAGAVLAALPVRGPNRAGSVVAEFAALAGIGLILFAAFAFATDTPWPGWRTLLPVAGAILLIGPASGSRLSKALLANPLAVGLGLVSYPLYLWHWPLLSFAHILHAGPPTAAARLVLVALALVLSILTFRLVEKPLRFGPWAARAPAMAAASLVLLAAAGLALQRSDGVPSRAITQLNQLALSARLGEGSEMTKPGCLVTNAPVPRPYSFCRHDTVLPSTAVAWGDSKAEALYWGLVRASHAGKVGTGWDLMGLLGGCPPMGVASSPNPECDRGNESIIAAIIADPNIRTVALVTGLRTIRYNGFERSRQGLDASIARLLVAGKNVVFVIDNPTVVSEREDARDCTRVTLLPLVERALGRRDCTLSLAAHRAETADYRELVTWLADRHPALRIFDTEPLLCDLAVGACPVSSGSSMLYSYGDHISDTGADRIAERLIPFLAPGPGDD